MSTSQRFELRCRECQTTWGNQPISFCQNCFAPLEVVYDWARISKVHYGASLTDTAAIGFDDSFQYEDFVKPLDQRRIPIEEVNREAGLEAYKAWMDKKDRIPY